MRVLAIMGSYRKGGTIDTVTDKVLDGASETGAHTEKITLVDKNIRYCRNCFTCYNDPESNIGACPIQDDVREILDKILDADGLILASSINMVCVTTLMKTFMERSCFTLSRPTGRFLWLKGIPVTRVRERKRAVIITSAGFLPRYLKFLFSYPEYQLAGTATSLFNADIIGTIFIESIRDRKIREKELEQAYHLGRLLASERLPLMKQAIARLRSTTEPLAEIVTSMIRL